MRKIHSLKPRKQHGLRCDMLEKDWGKKGFSVCVCISKEILLTTCVLVNVDSSSV